MRSGVPLESTLAPRSQAAAPHPARHAAPSGCDKAPAARRGRRPRDASTPPAHGPTGVCARPAAPRGPRRRTRKRPGPGIGFRNSPGHRPPCPRVRTPRASRPKPAARSLLPAARPSGLLPTPPRSRVKWFRQAASTILARNFMPERGPARGPVTRGPGVALSVPPETPPRARRFRPARPGLTWAASRPRVTLCVTCAGRRGRCRPRGEHGCFQRRAALPPV